MSLGGSMRETFPVAVHLILKKENQVLLLRRFQTGYEDGKYSLIAGHIDGNETVTQAMIREAKEEAGISIQEEHLKIVQVMHRKKTKGEYIDYFFEAESWEGNIVNNEPHKCDDLSWFAPDDFPPNVIPYIKYALAAYESNEKFTFFGWSAV